MTDEADHARVWLVERTFSNDKPNLIELVYATTDGERYFLKERALTGSDERSTTAARDVDPDDLANTDDDLVDRYASEAERMADVHDPDDEI